MILAHTVPISILDVDAAINQDLKALIPKRDFDASYLAAMLRAQHATILSKVSAAAHGTKKLRVDECSSRSRSRFHPWPSSAASPRSSTTPTPSAPSAARSSPTSTP